MALWQDRQYVSQYSIDPVGLNLVYNAAPVDADGDVTVLMVAEANGSEVFTRTAAHNATGDYSTAFNSVETSVPGPYTIVWTYQYGGAQEFFETAIEVGPAAPAYDGLTQPFKDLIDSVWIRIADEIDSPGGGPNAITYVQSKFGRGRIAQLMRIAMGRLNTMAQQASQYTVDGVGGALFPLDQWGSLLESLTWIEVLKHLIRIYTEQPEFISGGNISRLDRRDYMTRWRTVMQDEEATVKGQLDVFKIKMMGLGRPAVLISGGVYGRYGPTRMAGSVAARPRYWTRFY